MDGLEACREILPGFAHRRVSKPLPDMQSKLGPYNKKAGPEARLHYCIDSEARSEKQTTYVAEQPIHLCKEATCITTINRTVIVRQAEWQH